MPDIIPDESRKNLTRQFNRYMTSVLDLNQKRREGQVSSGQFLETIGKDWDSLLETIIVEVAYQLKQQEGK